MSRRNHVYGKSVLSMNFVLIYFTIKFESFNLNSNYALRDMSDFGKEKESRGDLSFQVLAEVFSIAILFGYDTALLGSRSCLFVSRKRLQLITH